MKYKETFGYRVAKILSFAGAYLSCVGIIAWPLWGAMPTLEVLLPSFILFWVAPAIVLIGSSMGILALYQYLTLKPVDGNLYRVYDNFLKEKLCTKEG